MLTAFLFPLVMLAAQTPAQDAIPTMVLTLEAQRRAAHLSGNADQLASILADDFVDIGANGGRRTKQQNVEETRAHVIQWTTLVATNARAQVLDSTTPVVPGEEEGADTYNRRPLVVRALPRSQAQPAAVEPHPTLRASV